MSFFDTVAESLKNIDSNIFYGAADQLNEWNYIVLQKSKIIHYKGSEALSFSVVVVRENYIDDDIPASVTEAVTAIKNVRRDGDIQFVYDRKKNTNTVVELVYIPFVKIGSVC